MEWTPVEPLTPGEVEQLRAMWIRNHAPADDRKPVTLIGGRVHWFGEAPESIPPSPRTPKPPSTLSRVEADAFMERNELERLCLADAPTDLERESLERSFADARRGSSPFPLPLPDDYGSGLGGKLSLALVTLSLCGAAGFLSALIPVLT